MRQKIKSLNLLVISLVDIHDISKCLGSLEGLHPMPVRTGRTVTFISYSAGSWLHYI